MGMLKVNWKKYLNSSNPTINKYLKRFWRFIYQTNITANYAGTPKQKITNYFNPF